MEKHKLEAQEKRVMREERRLKQIEEEKKKEKLKEEAIQKEEELCRIARLESAKATRAYMLKQEQKRKDMKQKFLQNEANAANHYKLSLIKRYGLNPWVKLMRMKQEKESMALIHYEKEGKYLKQWSLNIWREEVRQIKEFKLKEEQIKEQKADQHYNRHLLSTPNHNEIKQSKICPMKPNQMNIED
ncbi:MAG: hypothetical protein EZS28_038717 [Streblomastix strix]|uniref:Uncharacterized protein n=1 Tax=Streblomastix strix TaxID=222440 RepID=A0A5J4U4Q4_9EUKA|nr:MAG: hypothetical protein EZS28_038717 [Streblomastix strix]